MVRPKAFTLGILATYLVLPFIVVGYGLLLRSQSVPVNWTTLGAGFAIFATLIDLPLVGLAFWITQHTNESYERLMTETLDRALNVSTRMFVEHYSAEQERGALPVVPGAVNTTGKIETVALEAVAKAATDAVTHHREEAQE